MVHNYYQHRGGEDSVVEAELNLLRSNGHEVELYSRHNDDVWRKGALSAGVDTIWSRRTIAEVKAKIEAYRPDVIHAHNTFPLVSPSLYWVAERHRVPVVQTLHNFRLLCPQAMFLREQNICEDCVQRVPWRSVTRKCYRDSRLQSAAVASMLQIHRGLGTYTSKVTRYIALTEFTRRKFVAGGIPADKIVVKPNFVETPTETATGLPRRGFLYVGRVSPEKGVRVLAEAFGTLPRAQLEVLGEGSECERLAGLPNVTLRGFQSQAQVREAMLSACALVMPSVWYENFPRTLVEAFACRLPVIASRLGAMEELVEDGVTGLLFDPGDADECRKRLEWAIENPEEMRRMGDAAYEEFERRYTPEENYRLLGQIYASAIAAGAQT